MLTFCEDVAPPGETEKLTGFGLAASPFVLMTPPPNVRFTWKLVCPIGVITVTVPLYVPPPDSTEGFTVTVTVPGTACVNEGWSQFWPVVVVADTPVTVTAEPL